MALRQLRVALYVRPSSCHSRSVLFVGCSIRSAPTAPDVSWVSRIVDGAVSRRATKRARQAASGLAAQFASLGDDPISELELFSAARTVQDLDAILRREVEVEVSAILEVVQDFDAFDVIELMRLREFPVRTAAGLAPGYDGSGAVLDLIALVMLTRPTRNPSGVPREEGQPHKVIDDLHARAQRLVRLSSFWKQWTARLQGDTALARIAAQYQSYFVGVRRYRSEPLTLSRGLYSTAPRSTRY